MTTTSRLAISMAATALLAAGTGTAGAAEREFSLRFADTTNGNIAYAGNSLMSCTPSQAECAGARNGVGPLLNNNSFTMLRVNPLLGDGAATAASSVTLGLPADAHVLFAGLYWSARSASAARGAVALLDPQGRRTDVAAKQLDVIGSTNAYFAFSDVTNLVDASGPGQYTIADVQADVGTDKYGGWSLVVAYAARGETTRNLTVFDGAREVTTGSKSTITIPVSGFVAPPTGAVNTTVGFVAGEGDRSATGDQLKLNGTNLQNGMNPANNIANSTVSDLGAAVGGRNPGYDNQFGWDVDTFAANGIIPNGATSATLTATTSSEVYYPQVLSLATQVYAPDIAMTKTVTDVNGGTVERGDVLEYAITSTNNGSDAAIGTRLRDPVPGSTDLVPGSITVDGVARTDADDGDGGTYFPGSAEVVASLPSPLAVGASSTVRFRVTMRGTLPNGALVANRAAADYSGTVGGLKYASESNVVSVGISAPDLTLSKSANDFAQGGVATWTMQVRNVGGTALTSKVIVTDEIPAGVRGVRASGPGWSCEVIPAQVVCQRLGGVPAGGTLPPITMTGRVGSGDRVVNVARVTSDQDQNAGNDFALTENVFDVPKINVDFGTFVTVSNRRLLPGDRVTVNADYTHYDGVPATSRIELTLPQGMTARGASLSGDAQGDCTISGRTVTCAVGSLRTGESVRLVVTALVNADAYGGQAIVSTIQPTGGDVDPAQGNNTNAVTVDVLPAEPVMASATSLDVTKDLVGAAPVFGRPVTWRVTVRNTGGSTATGAYILDPLPSTATFVQARVTGGGDCANQGGVVRCDMGDLAPGQVRTATISASYLVIGEVANGATAYAAGGVRKRGGATAMVEGARLGVGIRTTRRWPLSSRVTATATIRGAGPLTARGTRLAILIPRGTGVIAAPGFTRSRGANGATVLTRRTGNLRQGTRRTFSITLRSPSTARTVRLRDTATASNAAEARAATVAITRRTRTPVTG